MSTITARRPHHLKKLLIAAARGAVLVLALAVSTGAWLLTRQDTRTAEEAANHTAPVAVAPASVAPPVSDQEMYQRQPRTGARSPEVLFVIVASEEAAAIFSAALQADGNAVAEVNLPSRQIEVVVVTTTTEERRLYQSAADLRGDDGLNVTVIDLRTPAGGARGACDMNFEPPSC